MGKTRNPCKGCGYSINYTGKAQSGPYEDCNRCERLIEHKKWLETQRKYVSSDTINTLDELLKQKIVMWNGHTTNIEVIKSMQLRLVLEHLTYGAFRKANRRNEGERQFKTQQKIRAG